MRCKCSDHPQREVHKYSPLIHTHAWVRAQSNDWRLTYLFSSHGGYYREIECSGVLSSMLVLTKHFQLCLHLIHRRHLYEERGGRWCIEHWNKGILKAEQHAHTHFFKGAPQLGLHNLIYISSCLKISSYATVIVHTFLEGALGDTVSIVRRYVCVCDWLHVIYNTSKTHTHTHCQ